MTVIISVINAIRGEGFLWSDQQPLSLRLCTARAFACQFVLTVWCLKHPRLSLANFTVACPFAEPTPYLFNYFRVRAFTVARRTAAAAAAAAITVHYSLHLRYNKK